MTKYTTLADVAAKIEWEGGIYETLTYGLHHQDIDEGAMPELHAAWKALEEVYELHFRPAVDAVGQLLPPDF